MKYIILLLALSSFYFTTINLDDRIGNDSKINEILHSKHFSIGIERLDFGYLQNKQIYYFDQYTTELVVTHRNLVIANENLPLENTPIKNSILDSLQLTFNAIKSFETNQNIKHKKLFNASQIHDFIYLQNEVDTVLLSDVFSKGFNYLPTLITNATND